MPQPFAPYPPGPPLRRPVTVVIGSVFLALAAVLGFVGSFLAFTVYSYTSRGVTDTSVNSGWGYSSTRPPSILAGVYDPVGSYPGVLLTAAAVLAVIAVVRLLLAALPGTATRGRTSGFGAALLIFGIAASVWVQIISVLLTMAARVRADTKPSPDYVYGLAVGAGGWIVLAAGVLAGVAAILLFVAPRVVRPPVWPAPWAPR